ncbi:putative serine/threonine-protein kinase PBL28 [Bidens hawaiensis]|uniref:putative serine/threonine-protein kinase PBL28 n=1 Tax=Bidens hawaiensis TaxID=980011 RepID=UPI00404B882B
MSSIEEVKHLHIPLQELSDATNAFSRQNLIAKGGFGDVCQGDHEFKTEISLLSVYQHENIVSLVGFCNEDGHKILVYEYESNGSLDRHLKSADLTWIQRLNICIDAARGLEYLHDAVGSQHRILHRDIKSPNILLDGNWKAKIADFGLSRLGPANTSSTFLISNVCGTIGYIDPDYFNTGYLTQKSDVYSFGVVLFEVLCGRPSHIRKYKDERQFLTNLIKIHWRRKTLDEIIHPEIQKQIKTASLLTFSSIAYQCLMSGNERPTMKKVVDQLQKALDNQLAPSGPWSDVDDIAAHHQGKPAGNESEIIQKMVGRISNELYSLTQHSETKAKRSADMNLVGIEARSQELKSLLKVGTGGVHKVGICGMWGIGKSTIAYSIYDEIRHEFEDHANHLDMLVGSDSWFGDGSRIIFITKNQYLAKARSSVTLNVRMFDINEVILNYLVDVHLGKVSPHKVLRRFH